MKVIGEFKKNSKGTWDLKLISQSDKSREQSVSYPQSRTTAVNKFLNLAWAIKPGNKFTLTLTTDGAESKSTRAEIYP